MGTPLFQVDAFTAHRFRGNPAAVCLSAQACDAAWMQLVAAEMNLSETAFLVKQAGAYQLRWFTPTVEVDLCGHATLAAAHILWETEALPVDGEARFETRSGLLTARRAGDWIELDFPADMPSAVPAPGELTTLLGTTPVWEGKGRFDLFAELESEETVRALRPDLGALAALPYRGLVVTASSKAPYDFVSRFFAPACGINEDPVTGSAHCSLGPYWRDRLGRENLLGFQASARGGEVRVRPQGERVQLGGQAVTVLRGELL